jgi:hypothetical protein
MTTATLCRMNREIQADVLAELRWGGSLPGTDAAKDGVVKLTGPDASALEHGSELDEQIFRLQCLVSHLLEKNEEIRQRLSRQASGQEEERFTRHRSGVH